MRPSQSFQVGKEHRAGASASFRGHASATTLIQGPRAVQFGVFVAAWNLDRHCLTQSAADTLPVLHTYLITHVFDRIRSTEQVQDLSAGVLMI